MPRANSKMRRLLAVGAASAVMIGLAACSGGRRSIRQRHRRLVDLGHSRGAHAVRGVQQGLHEAPPRHQGRAPARRELLPTTTPSCSPSSPATPRPTSSTSATTRSASSSTPSVLMPLNELMESDASQTKPDDFFPGLFGAAENDGRTTPRPNDSNPDVLWYDKVALEAAGITEDPADARRERRVDHREVPRDERQARGRGPHRSACSGTTGRRTRAGSRRRAAPPTTSPARSSATPTRPRSPPSTTLGQYFQDGTFVVADTMPEGAGADSVFVTHKAGFFSQGRYTIGTVESAGVAGPATTSCAGRRRTARRLRPASPPRYLAINGKTEATRRRVHVLDRVPERRGPDLPPGGRRQRRAVDQGR